MNFLVIIKPDLAYYEEAYDEMISSKRFKKLEPFFAVTMILFGMGLWYFDTTNVFSFFPFVFSAVGLYELVMVYVSRKKWLKDRLDSRILGQEMRLQFTEEFINHTGPFSSGEINWDGLKSITETKKGLIIRPENGTVIYLPRTLFNSSEEFEFILSKTQK